MKQLKKKYYIANHIDPILLSSFLEIWLFVCFSGFERHFEQ